MPLVFLKNIVFNHKKLQNENFSMILFTYIFEAQKTIFYITHRYQYVYKPTKKNKLKQYSWGVPSDKDGVSTSSCRSPNKGPWIEKPRELWEITAS